MLNIKLKNIIDMTELQKLSFKAMAKRGLKKNPLLVLNRKSHKEAFVILSYETYEKWQAVPQENSFSKNLSPVEKKFDFAAKGLFWDRPQLSNKEFEKILHDPKHPEQGWAASRIFERLPSQILLKLFSLPTLQTLFQSANLRKEILEPWKHAFLYWNQKTPCPR